MPWAFGMVLGNSPSDCNLGRDESEVVGPARGGILSACTRKGESSTGRGRDCTGVLFWNASLKEGEDMSRPAGVD